MSGLRRILLVAWALTALAHADEIKVAAASDLSGVMGKITAAFEKQTETQVSVSFGSSGNFFAQIENGAPFDVFLSADKSYPEKLEQAGKAEPGTVTLYARGRLVVWVPKDSALPLFSKNFQILTSGIESLTGPLVKKVAIANPQHAPYGRAAVAALQHYGIYEQVKAKLVLGENISQTAQFVQSGNVEVALVALSIARTEPMQQAGRYYLLPQKSYPPLDQAAVVIGASKNKAQARKFVEFLKSAEAQQILRDAGFETAQK